MLCDVVVLLARDRVEKIEALDLGADEYVNKPFNVGKLLARMRTATRHRMKRNDENPVLFVANIEIDSVRHRINRGSVEINLTPKEFELLSFLARHAGKVLTHRQILTAVRVLLTRWITSICGSMSGSCVRRSRQNRTTLASS